MHAPNKRWGNTTKHKSYSMGNVTSCVGRKACAPFGKFNDCGFNDCGIRLQPNSVFADPSYTNTCLFSVDTNDGELAGTNEYGLLSEGVHVASCLRLLASLTAWVSSLRVGGALKPPPSLAVEARDRLGCLLWATNGRMRCKRRQDTWHLDSWLVAACVRVWLSFTLSLTRPRCSLGSICLSGPTTKSWGKK